MLTVVITVLTVALVEENIPSPSRLISFKSTALFLLHMLGCFLSPGEKKLGKVITPDTWKDGARNTTGEQSKSGFVSVQWHNVTSVQGLLEVLED